MILKKWNYEKNEYEDYKVPRKWNCKFVCASMIEVVNCPHCGKEIFFGDGHSSMEIRTKAGWGYAVCKDCSDEEWDRRKDVEK